MKLFFEICKEFFDLLYLPFISDIIRNEIIREELDEEKGYQELSTYEEDRNAESNQYSQYIQDMNHNENIQLIEESRYDEEAQEEQEDEVFFICEFLRQTVSQTVSIINARIYKFIHDNKSE